MSRRPASEAQLVVAGLRRYLRDLVREGAVWTRDEWLKRLRLCAATGEIDCLIPLDHARAHSGAGIHRERLLSWVSEESSRPRRLRAACGDRAGWLEDWIRAADRAARKTKRLWWWPSRSTPRDGSMRIEEAFLPVGQGLFASVRAKDEQRQVSVVYDCGSQKQATADAAVARLAESTMQSLDAVIISHLDKDHVCGIPSLVKAMRPRIVMLPYVLPGIRAIAAAGADWRDETLQRLLVQPVALLRQLGAARIVVVISSAQDGRDAGASTKSPRSSGERPTGLNPAPDDVAARVREDLGDPRIEVVRGFGRLPTSSFYEFQFFALPARHYELAISARVERFFSSRGRRVGSVEDVRAVLSTGETRRLLRACYISALRRFTKTDPLNRSSIVVSHGPSAGALEGSRQTFELGEGDQQRRLQATEVRGPRGLLFGDFQLRRNLARLRAALRLDAPTTVSLPHHGALLNWDRGLLSDIAHEAVLVASAGPDSHHPSKSVVRQIRACSKRPAYRLADGRRCVVIDTTVRR